jgi:hypothetical protein
MYQKIEAGAGTRSHGRRWFFCLMRRIAVVQIFETPCRIHRPGINHRA